MKLILNYIIQLNAWIFSFALSCLVKLFLWTLDFCCCSSLKLCLTLCDLTEGSTPGFPVLHISQSLLKLMTIDSMMSSKHLILCLPPFSPVLRLSSEKSQTFLRSFPMSQLFTSGGQSTGASASASVLPMNIQGWFPLGLIDLISLVFKGLSRVFSNSTVQKHQFFSAQSS